MWICRKSVCLFNALGLSVGAPSLPPPTPTQNTWLGVWSPGYLSQTCHLTGEGSWGSHVVIFACFFTWEDGEGIFLPILMIRWDMTHAPSLSFGKKPMCVYWHEFQSEKKKATFISPHWSPHSSRWHMWQELGHTHRPLPASPWVGAPQGPHLWGPCSTPGLAGPLLGLFTQWKHLTLTDTGLAQPPWPDPPSKQISKIWKILLLHLLPPEHVFKTGTLNKAASQEDQTWGAALLMSGDATTRWQGLVSVIGAVGRSMGLKSRTLDLSLSVQPQAGNWISELSLSHPLYLWAPCRSNVAVSRKTLCKWWRVMQTTGALQMCPVLLQDMARHHFSFKIFFHSKIT